MKKILILITLAALIFCACGFEAEEEPEPVVTEPVATEPVVVEPEPVEPPIEISEFCDPEDMPAPFDGDGAFADISVSADGEDYGAEWLYYHNIYDWRQAGISYDSINDATEALLGQPFTADALTAFKSKISDFTMLIMLTPVDGSSVTPPAITVEYDGEQNEYSYDWLSSHNSTEYEAAHIPAETVKEYLDAISADFWYTKEYRWIEVVYDRMVNGWE